MLAGRVRVRVVETRVMRPTLEQLSRFSMKELKLYATGIGAKPIGPASSKLSWITGLLESGRATILSQLGD